MLELAAILAALLLVTVLIHLWMKHLAVKRLMVRMKRLELVGDGTAGVAYLYLKQHPKRGPGSAGCVANTVVLEDLIPSYQGPDIHLDFDKNGVLIGLEIVG
jgi:uncharacterized protein YuzE